MDKRLPKTIMKLISLDTETTGIDLYHSDKPFFVTISEVDDAGDHQTTYWEWDVLPESREIFAPKDDVDEILHMIESADRVVFQNVKFDVTALKTLPGTEGWEFPWGKVYDTLLAGHLLASKLPHDLTSMGIQYLGIDISPFETKLEEYVKAARKLCRDELPDWMIAKEGDKDRPSIRSSKQGEGKVWRADYWLPRTVVMHRPDLIEKAKGDPEKWETVVRDYSTADSEITLCLWKVMEKELRRRGLWDIYLHRLHLPRVAHELESVGITMNVKKAKGMLDEFREISSTANKNCLRIASEKEYDLVLPKNGRNKSLDTFLFDVLKLPVYSYTESNRPSFTADDRDHYELTLPDESLEKEFVRNLGVETKANKAAEAIEGYFRYLIDYIGEWGMLHPSLNPTGSDTIRWSSSNPNGQNISKKKDFNLRSIFGPGPGREWWSLDGKNLELRIPAYAAGEKELIEVFDHPEKGPYYGSYHLFIFDILYPELFREHGKNVKTLYEDTYYQWIKNGNFAVMYGAQRRKADATYRVDGAYDLIQHRFPRIMEYTERLMKFARKNGYVETLPSSTICPKRGYPIMCSRSENGSILPTTVLNYNISGTAMQWMNECMISVSSYLKQVNSKKPAKRQSYMVLQVHDELVFDLPKGRVKWENLSMMREIQSRMEACGDSINVPTPVSLELHLQDWSKGEEWCDE